MHIGIKQNTGFNIANSAENWYVQSSNFKIRMQIYLQAVPGLKDRNSGEELYSP